MFCSARRGEYLVRVYSSKMCFLALPHLLPYLPYSQHTETQKKSISLVLEVLSLHLTSSCLLTPFQLPQLCCNKRSISWARRQTLT